MSKLPTDKKQRFSKFSNHDEKRPFKVFAVNFHSFDLEVLQEVLTEEIKADSGGKMFAVTLQDQDETFTDESKKILHLVDDIKKCEKQFELGWKTLTSPLEQDLRTYWKGAGGTSKQRTVAVFPRKIAKTDLEVMNSVIDDIDVRTGEFIVVIFGNFLPDVLLDIIGTNIPLQAIIHFIPCPEADLEVKFPELHKDIDFLRKSPYTKNVGIFTESLMTATEYLQQEKYSNSKDIYDQFTWYLFDIEMLTQQFTAYLADFVEINDVNGSFSNEEQMKLYPPKALVEVSTSAKDTTAPGVYLDNLCSTIENHTVKDRRHSQLHLRPFLENNYGRIIVEEANELLISSIATQIDMVSYGRVVDVMMMNALGCDAGWRIDIQLPAFYELMSWETYIQKLEAERAIYDTCTLLNISEQNQLYTLQRTLHKVLETQSTFRLPTRLGFRDFCEYMVVEVVNNIKSCREQSESENQLKVSKFTGITFDDTLQQLSVTEKLYRFEDGSIKCTFDNWLGKQQQLTIVVSIFDCMVFVHRWEDYVSKFPQVRIATKNGVSCKVDLQDGLCSPNVYIHWPNDCQIQYITKDGVQSVMQWNFGIKRLCTSKGCVISYLDDDTIQVLTSNGVIYMLYPRSYSPDDQPGPYLGYINVKIELNFVRDLSIYGIYCDHFVVTRSDGRKLEVSNGMVVKEKANFSVVEWVDYKESECYAERDDGVKMIWSTVDFKCYYPCGTVITTTTYEALVDMSFDCRSKSTENILRKINPTLVERVASRAKKHDTYVTYNVHYLMQHKNYASVCCCGVDRMAIISPGEFQLVLEEHKLVLIDIGEMVALRISAGVCTITAGASLPKDKHFSLRLNLLPDVEDIFEFQSAQATLTLNGNGEMILSENDPEMVPKIEEIYFLTKRHKFGMEFLTDDMYNNIKSKAIKNKTYSFETPYKLVIFQPVLPIDEQFSISIPEFKLNLAKFKKVFQKVPNESNAPMERTLSAKVIHKLENVPTDITEFILNFPFTDSTLSDHLADALEHFLGSKTISPDTTKWKNKIKATKRDLDFKKQRMAVYNAMLRNNTFPKYDEFVKTNGNLNLIDVKELNKRFIH